MTEYTTVDEVRLALAPAFPDPDDDNTADTAASLSDTQLGDAIRQASARIDQYIGQRYVTPAAPITGSSPAKYPDPLPFWCRDIAAYLASLTLYRNQPMENTDPIWLRYQDVMAELRSVQSGAGFLNLPGNDDPSTGTGFAGVVDPGTGGLFGPEDIGMVTRVPFPGGWPGSGSACGGW